MKAITIAICVCILFAATGCKGGAEPWPDETGMDKKERKALKGAKEVFDSVAEVLGLTDPDTLDVKAVEKLLVASVEKRIQNTPATAEARYELANNILPAGKEDKISMAFLMVGTSDTDGNMTVTKNEVLELLNNEKEMARKLLNPTSGVNGMTYVFGVLLQLRFRVFDMDSDSKLSKAELETAQSVYMKQYDKDDDGYYSSSEWIEMNTVLLDMARKGKMK